METVGIVEELGDLLRTTLPSFTIVKRNTQMPTFLSFGEQQDVVQGGVCMVKVTYAV
jgi:hypothetical protein